MNEECDYVESPLCPSTGKFLIGNEMDLVTDRND